MFGLFKHSLGPAGKPTVRAVFGSNFAWDGVDGEFGGSPPPPAVPEPGQHAAEIVLRVSAPSAPPFWMLIYGADLERITGRGTVDAEALSAHDARFVIRPTVPGVSLTHVLDESRYVPERIATGAQGGIEVTLAPIAPDGQPTVSASLAGAGGVDAGSRENTLEDGGASLWLVGGDKTDLPQAEAPGEAEGKPSTQTDADSFASWLLHPAETGSPADTEGEAAVPSIDNSNDPWFLPSTADESVHSKPEGAPQDQAGDPLGASPSIVHAGLLGDAVGSVDWLSLLRRDPLVEAKPEATSAVEQPADPWFDWQPAAPVESSAEAPAENVLAPTASPEREVPANDEPAAAFEPSPWPSATPSVPADEIVQPEAAVEPSSFLSWLPEATGEPDPLVEARETRAISWDEESTDVGAPEVTTVAERTVTSLFDAPLVPLGEPEGLQPAADEDAIEGASPVAHAWPPLTIVNPDEANSDEAPILGSAAPTPRPVTHPPVVLVQDLYRRPSRDAEPDEAETVTEETEEPEVDDPQLIELAQRKPRVRGVNTYFESLRTSAPEAETPEEVSAPPSPAKEQEQERKPKFKLLSLFKKKNAPARVLDVANAEEIDFERFQGLDPFWRRLAVLSVELGLGSSEGASGGLARAVESGVQDVNSLVVAGGITEEQFTDLAALALGVPRLRVTAATPVADSPVGDAVPVGRVGHTLYVATSSLEPDEAIAPFVGRAPQTQALLVSQGELDNLSRGALRTVPVKDDAAPPRLGEVLVTFGHITSTQLDRALQRQEREQGSVGYLLRLSGEIDEATFIESLALQLGLPWIRVEQVHPYAEAVSLIPTQVAERYGVLGVARTTEGVYVGFIDALDEEARDAVRGTVNVPVLPVVVGRDGLARTFGRVFAA